MLMSLKVILFIACSLSCISCMVNKAEIENMRRSKLITKLKLQVIQERNVVLSAGIKDSDGNLFRLVKSYFKLKEMCTIREMSIIDFELEPSQNRKNNLKGATNTRSERIKELIIQTAKEHKALHDLGLIDGSGTLYQNTNSYRILELICSKSEMAVIDLAFGPPSASKYKDYYDIKNVVIPKEVYPLDLDIKLK